MTITHHEYNDCTKYYSFRQNRSYKMLPSLFKEKEEVQVLDEVTYIWEAARILGFISNWGVSVKWTEWKVHPYR